MTRYYVLDCHPPLDGAFYELEIQYPADEFRWIAGGLFSSQEEREGFHPPRSPISLFTDPGIEPPPRSYAELYWEPLPLMTRRLIAALRAAGVDNLQTFETRLVSPLGASAPPEDVYLAVNIVGVVRAADLGASTLNAEVTDELVSMDFHSLVLDTARALDLPLFRLAENLTAVLVHERVKKAVESAGISLTWFAPEEWAG